MRLTSTSCFGTNATTMRLFNTLRATLGTISAVTLIAVPIAAADSDQSDTVSLVSAGTDWCGTQRIFEEQYKARYHTSTAPEACDQYGACDDPIYRDGWIPDEQDGTMYVRMIIHVLADDDGSHVFSPPEDVAIQVDQLNQDYAQAGIQFIYQYDQVNASIWRSLAEDEVDDMKFATAIEPDKYLNVWVTVVEFSYSFGTFPWAYNAQQATGGIVMGHFHWNDLPNRVFAHEVGHCLGLYHTFHGVDEVPSCGECYETPGSNSSLIGDLCADTPPTPTNSGPCTNYQGNDPCSGLAWGYTMPENYMGYATQSCLNTFTPEQRGRMRCWTGSALDSWVIPFQVEIAPVLGPAPLEVQFTGSTYKDVLAWDWDFGDGGSSPEAAPLYTFQQPGVPAVTVDLQTASQTYHGDYTGSIAAYADTIAVDTGLFSGATGYVKVRVTNYVPLTSIEFPFTWSGPIEADFDYATTAGLRSANMTPTVISTVPSWDAAAIRLEASDGSLLAPGDGPVMLLRFTRDNPNATGTMPVDIWNYSKFELGFECELGGYIPVGYNGEIKTSCCVGTTGDANGDGASEPTIGDISILIDHLFVTGAALSCYPEADVNQSGGSNPTDIDITIGDISMLIDHLFVTGVALPSCQ